MSCILKEINCQRRWRKKNDDRNNESSSSDENEDSLEDENDAEDNHSSDVLYKAKNGTRYKKRKVPKIIRYVRYNKKKTWKITA